MTGRYWSQMLEDASLRSSVVQVLVPDTRNLTVKSAAAYWWGRSIYWQFTYTSILQ